MASVLSMESPPFRPRGANGGGGTPSAGSSYSSPMPHHRRNQSGTSSPLSHGSSGGDGYSNAIRSYSFQTPNGYVSVVLFCRVQDAVVW